jgi:hypothetical protein
MIFTFPKDGRISRILNIMINEIFCYFERPEVHKSEERFRTYSI